MRRRSRNSDAWSLNNSKLDSHDMANAQCFLSREEDSHKALDALVDQINKTQLEPDGVGVLVTSEHHRPQAEKLRGTLVTSAQLHTMTGTVSDASIVNGEAFFGEPMLGLLRWEPRPPNPPHRFAALAPRRPQP